MVPESQGPAYASRPLRADQSVLEQRSLLDQKTDRVISLDKSDSARTTTLRGDMRRGFRRPARLGDQPFSGSTCLRDQPAFRFSLFSEDQSWSNRPGLEGVGEHVRVEVSRSRKIGGEHRGIHSANVGNVPCRIGFRRENSSKIANRPPDTDVSPTPSFVNVIHSADLKTAKDL